NSSSRSTTRPPRTVRATMSEPVTGQQFSIWTTSKSKSQCTPSPTSRVQGGGPAQSSPRSTRPASFGKPNPSTRTTCNATHPATLATSFAPSGRCPTAVTVPARGQLRQNMPSLLNNYMGSVTQDRDPTTPPDWQVLLSGYAPLVLYAAVCVAGWVL